VTLDKTKLRAYLEPQLAHYKHLRACNHIPHFPRNTNGKLLRERLT